MSLTQHQLNKFNLTLSVIMQYLRDKIYLIEKRIFQINSPTIKRDLNKMLHNVNSQVDELSREAVECRRINSLQHTNRVTQKFTDLNKEIEENLYRLEKYITLYSLYK